MFEKWRKRMYATRASVRFVATGVALLAPMGAAMAVEPMGTAFTYQGRLEDAGGTITDTCDFEFSLWDAASGGGQVGNSPLSFPGIDLDGGLFTIPFDFGPDAINGETRWLEMAVCCPSPCAVVTLDPRQELMPTPHALALPGL